MMPSGVHQFESLRTQCYICSATGKKGGHADALYMCGEIEAELKNLGKQERLLITLLVKHGKADIFEHRAKHSEPGDPKRSGWCQRALKLYGDVKKARGLENAEYYRAIHGRGRVHIHLGEYEMGEERFLEAILGWKRIGCVDHPFIFMALEDRGNAMLQGGEALELAHRLCSEALQGCGKSLRSGHPQTRRARMNLGAVLLERGSLDKALELYSTSLRELQGEFGDKHAWTREVRDILRNLDNTNAAKVTPPDLQGDLPGHDAAGDATSEENLRNRKVAASRRGCFRAVMESLCCFPAGGRLGRRGQHKETLEP
jgi:tetratricopeptide (TPR) repeat protein